MSENNKKYDQSKLRSLRIEKQVLGYLLKSRNKEQDYYDVAPLLTEKIFSDTYNQKIFNVILSLIRGGQDINTVSVAQKLSDCGITHKDGNDIENYLEAVNFTQVSRKGFIEFCRELFKFHIRREAFRKAEEIACNQFNNASQSPLEILNNVNAIVDELKIQATDEDEPTFILEGLTDHIKEKANNPQKAVGIPWPYDELNHANGGLRFGDLHMILAQTGAGKTTFLMDVALKVALNGYHVIYLNTEMTDDEIRDRLGGVLASIEPILISTGELRREVVEYNKFLQKETHIEDISKKAGKYFIHKTVSHMPMEELESYIKYVYHKYVGKGKPCLICYDYLKITGEKTSSHNQEYQIIRNKSSQLKRIALQLNNPVITALQTNRQPDDDTLPLKAILKVDSTAMAMSHGASWDTSFLAYFKQKDVRELELDGQEFGTHKLTPLKIRAWGLGGLNYERPVRRETPDGLVYQKNHINFERGIFTLEPRGTLRDVMGRFDIQNNDAQEENPTETPEDDGTL